MFQPNYLGGGFDATFDNLTVLDTFTFGDVAVDDFTVNGHMTIDVDHIEAFLVRKDGDSGDVFNINTIDSVICLPDSKLGIGTCDPRKNLDVKGEIMASKFAAEYRETDLPVIVTFVSVGNYESNYTVAKPLFDSLGITGNVGVITDQVGTGGNLTWAQIKELENDGWEVISGAKTNTNLTTLTDAGLLEEVRGSKEAIEAQGLTVESFSNPGYYTDERVRAVIKDYYRSARSEIKLGYNPTPIQTYDLSSGLMLNTDDVQDWKDIVDNAIEQDNSWIIFYYQDMNSTLATKVSQLVAYINSKGLDIVNNKEALDIYENVIEAGDLPNGRGAAIASNGDTRIGNFGVLQEVKIWDELYPYTNYVSIRYENGDMVLCTDDHGTATKEIIICDKADGLRPEARRSIDLGYSQYEWDNTWTRVLNAQDGVGSVGKVNISSFNGTDTLDGELNFLKSGTSSIGTLSGTADNEHLGTINVSGVNASSSYDIGASISFLQNGIATANYIGSDIIFSTKENTDASLLKRMVIMDDGKVGIGTDAPSYQLDIQGITGTTGVRILSPNGSSKVNFFGNQAGDTNPVGGFRTYNNNDSIGEFSVYRDGNDDAGKMVFSTQETGTTTLAERMVIDSEGDVGINTSTPEYQLDVNGTTRATSLILNGGGQGNFGGFGALSLHTNDADVNWDTVFNTPTYPDKYFAYYVYSGEDYSSWSMYGSDDLANAKIVIGSGTIAGIRLNPSSGGVTSFGTGVASVVDSRDDVFITRGLETGGGRIQQTNIYTANRTLDLTNHVVFGNTDAGGFTFTLPAGIQGLEYQISNVGINGNTLVITPNGTEEIFRGGAGVSFNMYDGEGITIHYDSTIGWH